MAILKTRFFILIGIVFFIISSFLFFNFSSRQYRSNLLVIGSKNCTENQILSEIIAILIEKNTTLKVKRKFNLEGTLISFEALKSKDIDLYPEYSGSALLAILKDHKRVDDQKVFDYLKKIFEKKYQITWLDPFGFENKYVLLMNKKKTKNLNIYSISDLVSYLQDKKLKISFDPEFSIRDELLYINKTYNVDLHYQIMDQSLIYFSLSRDVIDLSDGFSTDSKIKKYDLTILKDDKKAMPSYIAAPIVRKEIIQKYPEIVIELKKLSDKITNKKIKKLIYLADEKKQKVYDIAFEFLKSEKLI